MDSSLVSSLYLVPEWTSRMLEDYNCEVEETSPHSLRLLEGSGRRAVWALCGLLGAESHGVPAQACRLLERFLFKHFTHRRLLSNAVLSIENISSSVYQPRRQRNVVVTDCEEWRELKRSLAKQLPLLISSCVQLAAKMSSSSVQVSATLVRTCLFCKGVDVSVPDILRSEFHVFSSLGFRVPLWTSQECAQMLALEAGLRAGDAAAVAQVVNVAEYRRDRVAARVLCIANMSPHTATFSVGSLSTLHLAAGAVAATARYLALPAPELVPRLASLTRAPPYYIKCVSGVILTDVLVNDTELANKVHSRKRKRSH